MVYVISATVAFNSWSNEKNLFFTNQGIAGIK